MKTTKLPKGATKLERLKAHLVKMGAKKINRNRLADLMDAPYSPANLSRNHPDYGMTVEEHEKSKDSEKSS